MDLDILNIPAFALLRHGTVVVRLKEVAESCCRSEVRPAKGFRREVHRLSGCEQCNKTRLNPRYSDCDSGKVNKTTNRPYRASAARSRYVNVCAAVCLLLVVGGLAPQAAAAPRHRAMDRTKRSEMGENQHWANPCDLADESIMKSQTYKPKLAIAVAKQANGVLHEAEKFKSEVAKAHSYENIENLIKVWNGTEFLRTLPWHQEDVLPANKMYGTLIDEEQLDELMKTIDTVLPAMYKSLKVVVASLFHISEHWAVDTSIRDDTLQTSLQTTGSNVKSVLCAFYDVMRARNLEVMPLLDSELPHFDQSAIDRDMFLVYRDTLNYLEYINQVFNKLAEIDQDKNA